MRTAADSIGAATKTTFKTALWAFLAAFATSVMVGLYTDQRTAEQVAGALGTVIGYGIFIGWPLAVCHYSLRAWQQRRTAERIDKEIAE